MLNALLSGLLGGCNPCDNSCYNQYPYNQQQCYQQSTPCSNQWCQYPQQNGCNNGYNPFVNNCCNYYPQQCQQQVCYQGPACYPQPTYSCCCDNDKDHKKEKKKKKKSKDKKKNNHCNCNCCCSQGYYSCY
ncbi:MAG: hypothetical protein RR840_10385 [Clostridium sp.]